MNEDIIWQEVNFARERLLEEVKDVSEEAADQMPEGFRNTIRWNLGHVFVVHESLIAGLAGETPQVPSHYGELFAPGTKPADWGDNVPSLSELREKLEGQINSLQERFGGRLDEKVANTFKPGVLEPSTIGEVLTFALYHEGLHNGVIKGLKRSMGM